MIDKLADLSDATIKGLIAVLAGMIIVWQRTDSAAIKVRLLTLAASGGLGFGLALEAVQANLPYRDFSMADVLADALGIAIGMLPWPGIRNAGEVDLRNSPDSA